MVQESVRRAGRPLPEASEPHERLAALIRSGRPTILASYAKNLEALNSPVVADPHTFGLVMADASEILADVAASVRGNGIRIDEHYQMLPRMISAGRTESQPSPADLLRAATTFFEVTVDVLAGYVRDDYELMQCFATAVVTLNESIGRRIKEATLAYTGYLLERVEQAQTDERRRVARDLHDRLGEGLSVALRQLELHELGSGEDPLTPSPRTAKAKEAITEAMRRLRMITSDLRQDFVRSLEQALIQYIDSVAADADVQLQVSGNETWAPSTVIEESFLIIREAVRNALRHGHPRKVLVGLDLAPHELHAWVEDDGCGFMATASAAPASAGTGLSSMRERAVSMGGRLTIASRPGQGTHIELLVPLPGHSDE